MDDSKFQDFLKSNYFESYQSASIARKLKETSIKNPVPQIPIMPELEKMIEQNEELKSQNKELIKQNKVLQNKVEKLKTKPRDKALRAIIEILSGIIVGLVCLCIGRYISK